MDGIIEFYVKGKVAPELSELLDSIRKKAYVHRIRVHEFFYDFDKLRCGHITRAQFRVGLNMCGFKLRDMDFNMIAESFAYPPSLAYPDHVRWHDFADFVDAVFTVKELEKKPTLETKKLDNSQGTGSLLPFNVPLTTKMFPKGGNNYNGEILGAVMDRFRERATERRVLMKNFFQDFDKHNVGRVTQQQFRRVISKLEFECSEAEMQAILAYYSDADDGDVNWVVFAYDVVPRGIPEGFLGTVSWKPDAKFSIKPEYFGEWDDTRNPNPPPFAAFTGAQQLEFDRLINKIRNCVQTDRIRLKEFFTDYDKGLQYGTKLRKGVIPSAKFATGISQSITTIHISPTELQLLTAAFQTPEDAELFRYDLFLRMICDPYEEAHEDLEKMPTISPNEWVPLHYPNQLSAEQESKLEGLLKRIRERIGVRRVLVKPFFQDFDSNYISTSSLKSRHMGAHTAYRGRVTKSQFRRVLVQYGFELTIEEFQLLERKFCAEHYPELIDYLRFCETVDAGYGMKSN